VSDFVATRSKNDEYGIFPFSRVKRSDLHRVMSDYPDTFISPPKDAYDDLDILDEDSGNTWFADIPLWSEEEGMSDLCLVVTIILDKDAPPRVELDDCRVP
jgi:hypothetical protein